MLICFFASSAFGAPSDIRLTDCDPQGRSKTLLTYIFSNPVEENFGSNQDWLTWNTGTDRSNPSNPAQLADMPDDATIFNDLLVGETAPVEIRVHLRIKLDFNNAEKVDKSGLLGTTIALNYFTSDSRGHGGFDFRTLSTAGNELPAPELGNIEKLVVLGADGKVQILDAATLVTASQNDYRVWSISYGNVWDTQSSFPMTVYGVSCKYLEHDITVTQPDNGAIAPLNESGVVKVKHGGDAEFTITANSGYRIDHLLVDGASVSAESKYFCAYKFANVTAAHSISALFEEDKNAPEISADSGVTGSLVDLIESASDAVVAAFEKGGFTGGGKTIHVVNLDKDTKMEGSFTADAGGFAQAVKLKVEYEEGSESNGLTLTVKPADAAKPFSADKKYYALLLNKKTNYYDLFPAARNASGDLAVKIAPVGDYFSEGTVFIYSGTAVESETPVTPVDPTTPSGPKSGGGCTAGIGALALLALAPLYLRRKR